MSNNPEPVGKRRIVRCSGGVPAAGLVENKARRRGRRRYNASELHAARRRFFFLAQTSQESRMLSK